MYKDEVLDSLAEAANVAQFVSFSPEGKQRFCRIFGYPANHLFDDRKEAIAALLAASPEQSVNVRSFRPDSPQGNAFHYGLRTVEEAVAHVERLASEGFHTIVNETVDVDDGGVSGVLFGGCMEFAPGQVPRFVEKDAEAPIPALPREFAMDLLQTVYGFAPNLEGYSEKYRVEFSTHPKPRGWQKTHTIIWEEEVVEYEPVTPFFSWPNPFSRLIGDKAYGLLIAHCLGLPVPRTTVFPRNRRVSIFTFGEPTGNAKVWTRTCPKTQEPGKYTTTRGWKDPYHLMESDDPDNKALASCLVQEEVASAYAGALLSGADGEIIFEGVAGFGDEFMLGSAQPAQDIPDSVTLSVNTLYRELYSKLGPVRFEWAHDGVHAWIMQLHKGASVSYGRTIFPGEASDWIDYDVKTGLETLRVTIEQAKGAGQGIKVHGHVGMSSHIADLLRKAKIPSVMN